MESPKKDMESDTKVEIGVDNLKWLLPLMYFWSRMIEEEKPEDVPKLLVLGPPGIGKTQVIKKVVKTIAEVSSRKLIDVSNATMEKLEEILKNSEFSLVYLDWKAAQRTIDDIYGKLSTKEILNRVVSINNPPANLAAVIYTKDGILFLDELTLVQSPALRSALLKIVNEGQIGDWKTDAFVVAAGNTREHTDDAVPLPGPLLNRYLIINARAANAEEMEKLNDLEDDIYRVMMTDLSGENIKEFSTRPDEYSYKGVKIVVSLFYLIARAFSERKDDLLNTLKGVRKFEKKYGKQIFRKHFYVSRLWEVALRKCEENEVLRRGFSNYQTTRTLDYLGRILTLLNALGILLEKYKDHIEKVITFDGAEMFEKLETIIRKKDFKKEMAQILFEEAPSTMEYTIRFLDYVANAVGVTNSGKELLKAIVYGLIGPNKGGEFLTYIEFEIPHPEELLQNPSIIGEYIGKLQEKFEEPPYISYLTFLAYEILHYAKKKLREFYGDIISLRSFRASFIEEVYGIGEEIKMILGDECRRTFLYTIYRMFCKEVGVGSDVERLKLGYRTIIIDLKETGRKYLANEFKELLKANR